MDWFGPVKATLGAIVTSLRWLSSRGDERDDWATLVELNQLQNRSPASIVWSPEVGSPQHKQAERMVTKRMLLRAGRGPTYRLA